LKRIAATIYENGGVVGAVCHGPAIFENLRLSTGTNILHGKKATGFSEKGEESIGTLGWIRQNGRRYPATALHLSRARVQQCVKSPDTHSTVFVLLLVLFLFLFFAVSSGYKTMEQVVRGAGGDWNELSDPLADHTQTTDRVVTGMNPASAKSVAVAMMKFMPASKDETAAVGEKTLLGTGTHDKQAAARFADKESQKQWTGEQTR